MAVENRGTKKSPRWRYAFTIRGVRYRASVPEARTKYEAEQAEIEAKKAVFEGRYGGPTGSTDFCKFFGDPDAEGGRFPAGTYMAWARDNKRSWKFDQWAGRVLRQYFAGKALAQITPMLVEKYKSDRRKGVTKWGGQRTPASVNRELELLSRVFARAIELKLADTNPCSRVKKFRLNNKRRRYLLDEEEPRLMAACEGALAYLRPVLIVALGTGMRRGDLFALRKSMVDFQRGQIWVPNAKTGSEYPVPMSPEVREVMQASVRSNPESEYVFINPHTGRPYRDLSKGLDAACRAAGITDLHWHDLRHTFGTRMAEAGHGDATIAELMGHADRKTTARYTHGTEAAKRSAVEAARPRAAVAMAPAVVVEMRG
jgi:integrase